MAKRSSLFAGFVKGDPRPNNKKKGKAQKHTSTFFFFVVVVVVDLRLDTSPLP